MPIIIFLYEYWYLTLEILEYMMDMIMSAVILLEFQTESLNHHYLHYLHWLLNVPMPAELYDFKVFRSLRVFRGETFQVSLLARRNRCEARYFPRDFSRELRPCLRRVVSQPPLYVPICLYVLVSRYIYLCIFCLIYNILCT